MEKRDISKDTENRYWIREGKEVSHRDMLGIKMIVDRILYKHIEINKEDEGNEKQSIRRLMGVECHWIEEGGRYMQGKFHTKELIPYEVAIGGIEEIKRWDIKRFNMK